MNSVVDQPVAGNGEGAAAHAFTIPDSQVVLLFGLPLAALTFIGLILGIAVDKAWPLTFLHVAFGAAWITIDLFLGFIIGPLMRRLSISARIELTVRLMPKMVLIMPTVVTVTLAAGWQLGHRLDFVDSTYYLHGWMVTSYVVVG